MDPEMLKQVALGTLPPFAAVFLGLLLLWRETRGPDAPRSAWRTVAAPSLLGIVYICTHLLMFGIPDWPIRRALHTLVLTALAAGVAGTMIAARRAPGVLVFALCALAAGVGAWLAARGPIATWGASEVALRLGGVALAGGVNALAAEYVVRHLGGRGGPVVVLIAVGGAAQVLATGFFSLSLGQAAGVGAAMLAGAIAASFAGSSRAVWQGASVVPVSAAMVAMFQGTLFAGADRPLLLAGLCASALPAGAILLRALPRGWSGVRRTACVLLGALLPLGVAVVIGAVGWLEANKPG